VPIGYLIGALVGAIATALALWPRRTHGPRATLAFIIESNSNELPCVVFYWLVLSTVLAVLQGNLDSPVGWIGFAVTVVATLGLAIVVARALAAREAIEHALSAGLGPARSNAAGSRAARSSIPLGRVLIAPLRFSPRVVRRERNITYGPAGKRNLLDVYRPQSRPEGCPAFIYFHPGGFFSGGKSREARPIFDRLVRHGWVCVSANYRLRQAGMFPRNLVDAKLVIAWVRENAGEYGVDPGSIVVAGGSAGANLAVTCALSPNETRFQPGFEDADTSVVAAVGLYGYYGPAPTDESIPSSPEDYARADAPPLLLLHGERDPMVPARDVRRFAERIRDASSNPVVYAELPGGQHNFDTFSSIRCAAVADGIEAFAAWVRSPVR
jgi:acetyl esterase/lipase